MESPSPVPPYSRNPAVDLKKGVIKRSLLVFRNTDTGIGNDELKMNGRFGFLEQFSFDVDVPHFSEFNSVSSQVD